MDDDFSGPGPRPLRERQRTTLDTLARLARESAAFCDLAAASARAPTLATQLRRQRDRHLRHLEELNALLATYDAPAVPRTAPDGLLMDRVGALFTPFGDEAILLGLIGHVQLANAAYEVAFELGWEPQVDARLEQHLTDLEEQLDWLGDRHDELAGTKTRDDDDAPPLAQA